MKSDWPVNYNVDSRLWTVDYMLLLLIFPGIKFYFFNQQVIFKFVQHLCHLFIFFLYIL